MAARSPRRATQGAGDPDLVVELDVPAGEEELAADRLWQAGATAVLLDGAGRVGPVKVVASFPTAAAARTVAGELAEAGARLVEVDPSWRDGWKEWAEPFSVGRGLVVTPAWRQVEAAGRLVLRIDPGGAFGSGSHASTRMVLAELDRDRPAGLDVLDLGCGSGILSIAAALLGARRVLAVDIDPEAQRVTLLNCAANGVSSIVTLADHPSPASVDLALVNVTAGVHATVGGEVVAAVRPGGSLVLAGLLPGQWRHVASAYRGASVVARLELDGWEGVRLRRN